MRESENTLKVNISNKSGLVPKRASAMLFAGVNRLHWKSIPLEEMLSRKQLSNTLHKRCIYSKGHFPGGMEGIVCGCAGEQRHWERAQQTE